MSKSVFFHVTEQELRPSESSYENISKINEYKDNSLESIILQDTCDYLIREDVPVLIKKICGKLISGGKLYIQGSDFKQLCVAVTFDMMPETTIMKVLYPDKKSIHNMGEILKYLKDNDMSIVLKKYINIFEYYIEAVKGE